MYNLLLYSTAAAATAATAAATTTLSSLAPSSNDSFHPNASWPLWELTTATTTIAVNTLSSIAMDPKSPMVDAGGGGGGSVINGSSASGKNKLSNAYALEGNSMVHGIVQQLLLNITNAQQQSHNYLNGNMNSSNSNSGSGSFNISHQGGLSYGDETMVTETPYVPYVMRPETYIVPVLFAFIFIVGVLGNGTLILVFLGVRQMRNVPNTYILSLALADLLLIVTTVPLTSTVYTVESWPWGDFLCTLSEFIKDVSIGVSVFTLTALSGDRYFAIVDPLRKFHAHGGGKRATRMTIAIAVSIWLLAIICGIPAILGTKIKNVPINLNKSFALCYPFPEEWGPEYAKTMVMLRFLVYYAIPLVIIGVFYVLIARHLMYAANVPGEMQGAVRQVRARRKVAVTVLAFVVIFGICFLPYHVFMLWFYYWPTAEEDYNFFWHVLRIVGFCLSFANSCANPVALYFVSGAFRKHFNRYLFCQGSGVRHKKRQHNDTLCMHRDTSLTSTASKRYYSSSRRSCHHQSTIRSRLQETTITMLPNGGHNGGPVTDISDMALTDDYYDHSPHQSHPPQTQSKSLLLPPHQQQQQHQQSLM